MPSEGAGKCPTGPPLSRRRRGRERGYVDLSERRDEGLGQELRALEAGRYRPKLLLVHVKPPGELDLDGVHPLARPPVVPRREAALVGIVMLHAEAEVARGPIDSIDHEGAGARAATRTRHDV